MIKKGEMNMKLLRVGIVCLVLFAFFLVSNAIGADKIKCRWAGAYSKKIPSELIEKPFVKRLTEESGGKLEIEFHTHDEIGSPGTADLRQLKAGVFDIMQVNPNYVAGDEPYFDGMTLIGLAPDVQTARVVMDAYFDVLDKRLQEKWNSKLLALWIDGTQGFYFKEKINGLDGFKGKKIRCFSRDQAKFITHFGGTPVTMALSEAYMALQRGVVEAAITGLSTGNLYAWYEVTKYLYPLPMGHGPESHIANLDWWKKLGPEMQKFLSKKFKGMEDELWKFAMVSDQDGINCNCGKDPCKWGKKGDMILINPTPEDKRRMQKVSEEIILPVWAKGCDRVDENCSKAWNSSVGKALGMTIKLNK
jgi:TRAP-type C4-dicarboxylate transport system substrate-binding protein